jgi:SAM-dependent methyltransferase
MNWRVKGIVQGVLSAVPGGRAVNDRLQTSLGNLRDFDHMVDRKVTDDWLVFAEYFRELGLSPAGLDILEIGTGWFPTLPVCFYLAGARSCHTFDLHSNLNWQMTRRMLRRLEVHLAAIAAASRRDLASVTEAYQRLLQANSIEVFLEQSNIRYHAPADATQTGFEAGSVDVVFSNSVLEHVPAEVIRGLMRESRRILRPGGVAMHCANCGDHYAYFDKSITMLNYLTYTQREWERWNNELLYQNRMRPRDFVASSEGAGLKTLFVRFQPTPELLKVLPEIPVSPEFRDYPPEELCATSIGWVSQAC